MKISFSLRAFVVYFLILGSLLWFTLDNAIERLNDGMRQSAESVMVDIAHLVASLVETDLNALEENQTIPTERVEGLFQNLKERTLAAKIYQIVKTDIDTDVYITNASGTVIYDSSGVAEGQDFSRWRDVKKTLEGEYGARTSYKDQRYTEPEDEKIMVVAAPLTFNNDIVGVVSVVKSINSLEGYLVTESNQLKRYGLLLLLAASALGYIISMWFNASLGKITRYADTMAAGRPTEVPKFMDTRFNQLAASLTHMRQQLDGKEYVENYIHSLTHELKTPITSIRGAVELLDEDMPAEDRIQFLKNIDTSNRRMARLVDKMLSLAKLESLRKLDNPSEFDFQATLQRLLTERDSQITTKNITIDIHADQGYELFGEKLLISQAVANLLDNAMDFCLPATTVEIRIKIDQTRCQIEIENVGPEIPDYAMDKMFDRFFSLPRPAQVSDSSHDSNKSTGLGLSFVKEIMKLHGGTVRLNNTATGVVAQLRWSRPSDLLG